MSFLVPKPIGRQVRTKVQRTSDQNSNKSSIFDKIRDLCRLPNPEVETLNERLFISSIFEDIHELCRRPELLSTIDEQWAEEQKNQTIVEPVVEQKVWQKKQKQYYSGSNDSNSFDTISKSKIFTSLVRGRHQTVDTKCVTNQTLSGKLSENINNDIKQIKKRTKSCTKSQIKVEDLKIRKPLKSLLTIDFDITSKITEYSKEFSNIEKNTKQKANKCCKRVKTSHKNCSQESASDSGVSVTYESIPSPAVSITNTMSYSMPATPVSSIDSQFSQCSVNSCETTSSTTASILSKIRKSLNPKYETYEQYIQRCAQKELDAKTRKRRSSQMKLDFKEKVLEWSNKLCSGNTTPTHNIEYLATPPGSPQIGVDSDERTNDELNAIINSINSLEHVDYIQSNDNLNNEFNNLLSDLYSNLSDIPMDFDIS